MKKPQWILIGITGAFLCLVLGIFVGRNLTNNYISVGNLGNSNAEVGSTVDSNDNNEELNQSDSENKDGRININTATAEQLTLLPGIGDVIAQRIIDYRTTSGPFRSVDDLLNISGIGEAKLAQIKPYAKVD